MFAFASVQARQKDPICDKWMTKLKALQTETVAKGRDLHHLMKKYELVLEQYTTEQAKPCERHCQPSKCVRIHVHAPACTCGRQQKHSPCLLLIVWVPQPGQYQHLDGKCQTTVSYPILNNFDCVDNIWSEYFS